MPLVLLKRVLQLEGSGLSPFPPVAFLQSTVELAYVVFLLYDVYTMWGYENVINLSSAMSRNGYVWGWTILSIKSNNDEGYGCSHRSLFSTSVRC